MHILLVEDEAPKETHIRKFLDELADNIVVTVARSVTSALDELERRKPDLLLLDMSLPTFDLGEHESGGRPQGFGGKEVLRSMSFENIVCPTIVVTGYEAFPSASGKPVELAEICVELETEFPQLFRGVLHYNSTYDEWKHGLKRILAEFGITGGKEC